MNDERRGKYATVRGYGGKIMTLRIWEETETAIHLHDETEYQKHARGIACKWPVWFPKDAVIEVSDER